MTSTRWAAARNGAAGLPCFTIRGGRAPRAVALSGCPDKGLWLRPGAVAGAMWALNGVGRCARPAGSLEGSDPEAGCRRPERGPAGYSNREHRGYLRGRRREGKGGDLGKGVLSWWIQEGFEGGFDLVARCAGDVEGRARLLITVSRCGRARVRPGQILIEGGGSRQGPGLTLRDACRARSPAVLGVSCRGRAVPSPQSHTRPSLRAPP
jgi:hypothetical protein